MLASGVTLNKHYCMDRLISMAYFHEAHDCADIMGLDEGTEDPMGCCDDVTEEVKVDDFQKTSFEFQGADLELVEVVDHQSFEFNPAFVFDPAFYAKYKPPLIEQDIPVLIQSFLI